MPKIQRALLSVTHKEGLVELAKFLQKSGIEILSTGGTAKLLRENNVAVKDVSEHTGSPEILDGRVKTLHPKIHGGLLGVRQNPDHQKQMFDNNITPIDLVVVNLYDFENVSQKPNVTLNEAIENIDIGGPSMLRSAAKNHADVTVVVDPKDYTHVMSEIAELGNTKPETRFDLAKKVFATTARYDQMISEFLEKQTPTPATPAKPQITIRLQGGQDLRYGENPHQLARFHVLQNKQATGMAAAKQIHGKELSYNNILDADAAWSCVQEFLEPAAVIVKHNNPCGVSVAANLSDAFLQAKACDPVSSFGGIVAFNKPLDAKTAALVSEIFFEVIIAPSFESEAEAILKTKKNLRLLVIPNGLSEHEWQYRSVTGGLLIQERDQHILQKTDLRVVTKREPTPEEVAALMFAWSVAKHVKSNAIVFSKDTQTLGIGAGQMSRVDSVKIAGLKAADTFKNPDVLKGSVLASDAFFPFRDGLDFAATYGIKAVIQPGGSVRDDEVIQAANEHDIAMVLTGVRHFRH